VSDLCEGAVAFLLNVYDEDAGLFPFSTRLAEGRLVRDFAHPHTRRYTINSFLGLRRAALCEPSAPSPERVDAMIERFLERQFEKVSSRADLGLLALLLSERDDHGPRDEVLAQLAATASNVHALRASNLQELGWMLWGTSVAARTGAREAEAAAGRIFEVLCDDYVDDRTGLARHSRRLYRRGLVSFGSTVYFLRSMHEYAQLSGSDQAERLFVDGVSRVLGLQGPSGEWPWIISVGSARAVEFYPVFGVHQDSMAMLFLHPALDKDVPWTREAIERSFAWALGQNELGIPMLMSQPHFAYRSIERAEPLGRELRYVRALTNIMMGRSSRVAMGTRVRINPECRSYHLGWILYAWAGRQDLPGTDGERLRVLTATT
jgi:hypothetical protein